MTTLLGVVGLAIAFWLADRVLEALLHPGWFARAVARRARR